MLTLRWKAEVQDLPAGAPGAKVSRRMRVGILMVLILMNFRTFEYFPGFRLVQEGWYVFCVLAFFLFYPLFKNVLDWTFTGLELYFLAILPVLFLIPAATAHSVFGQPLLYGILPQRSAFPVLLWILLINAWRCEWFTFDDLRTALLANLVGTFILYELMRLVLNPANYDIPGFVIGVGSDAVFSFSGFLQMFGAMYYLLEGIREGKRLSYVIGGILVITSIGSSGRALLVSIIATFVVFLFKWRGVVRSLPVLVSFAVSIAVVLGISYLINPVSTADRIDKFHQAFLVAEGAPGVSDASANARVTETLVAKPYIAAHPFLGVGSVSKQWEGGVVAAVGDYFVPGDIGVVGIAFTYGYIGLFLFIMQYIFGLRAYFQVSRRVSSRFYDGIAGMTLLTAIYSLTTGFFVFNIELTSFFVILLTLPTIAVRGANPGYISGGAQARLPLRDAIASASEMPAV